MATAGKTYVVEDADEDARPGSRQGCFPGRSRG